MEFPVEEILMNMTNYFLLFSTLNLKGKKYIAVHYRHDDSLKRYSMKNWNVFSKKTPESLGIYCFNGFDWILFNLKKIKIFRFEQIWQKSNWKF